MGHELPVEKLYCQSYIHTHIELLYNRLDDRLIGWVIDLCIIEVSNAMIGGKPSWADETLIKTLINNIATNVFSIAM